MKTTYYLTAIATLAFAACSEKKDTTETSSTNTGDTSALTAVITDQKPGDPKSIYAVRKTAKPGETLTITGKVMGRVDPFVPGRAIMVLGDPEIITSCDLNPDDHCQTPWDVCCDDPDVIKESTLTVQVLDSEGNLVKSGLKGISGIKELSELVVTGVVDKNSNADNLMLNATAIYVKK